MNPMPDAAVAVIAAALDDYRLTTPPTEQTPHGAAQRAAQYLHSNGWRLYIPGQTRTRAHRESSA